MRGRASLATDSAGWRRSEPLEPIREASELLRGCSGGTGTGQVQDNFVSAVAVTLGAWAGDVQHVLSVINVTLEQQHLVSPAAVAYVVLITALVAGSLAYLSARYGYARRLSRHQPASDAEIDVFRTTVVPSVTI